MTKYYTPNKLSENIRETPEGYLLCIGVPIARTGEMEYGDGETPLETDSEGKVLIYRDEKEVFNVNTIASFEGKPVTIKHPQDFVDPKNWSYLAKGVIQNVRKAQEKDQDGEQSLIADLLITDALAISLIKAGLREVSCGYEAEYEEISQGKGRQTNIIGNHLALVEQGRAGEAYAIQDHKGKSNMSKLAENLKKFFGKAVDEAMAEEKKEDKAKDEEEKKEDKAKDDDMEKKSKDAASYDELVKMVKDLGEKLSAMGGEKSKDADEEKKPMDEDKEEKKEDSKDADESPKMEERLKALEAAVAKLLEMQNKKSEDDMEESEDEEEKEDKKKTGDSKITGLEQTKNPKTFDSEDSTRSAPMTAEKMNEINAALWARK